MVKTILSTIIVTTIILFLWRNRKEKEITSTNEDDCVKELNQLGVDFVKIITDLVDTGIKRIGRILNIFIFLAGT